MDYLRILTCFIFYRIQTIQDQSKDRSMVFFITKTVLIHKWLFLPNPHYQFRSVSQGMEPVPDLPIGSIGWSLRASQFRVPPANVYNIFNTVIELSHLCCHNVLYFLNDPFSKFPYTVALHFRILHNFKKPSSSSPLLKLIKHTSIFLQSWRWGIWRGLTSRIA
jgi:hypothetical protein